MRICLLCWDQGSPFCVVTQRRYFNVCSPRRSTKRPRLRGCRNAEGRLLAWFRIRACRCECPSQNFWLYERLVAPQCTPQQLSQDRMSERQGNCFAQCCFTCLISCSSLASARSHIMNALLMSLVVNFRNEWSTMRRSLHKGAFFKRAETCAQTLVHPNQGRH